MLLAIVLYSMVWIASSWIVLSQFQRRDRRFIAPVESVEYTSSKLSLLSVIIISVLFTVYNYVITTTSSVVGSDRQNYIYNFNGYRDTPSVALEAIMKAVRFFGGSAEALFYLTTFVCVLITMVAYRVSKNATPQSFILLCVTQYFLATLTALKQCYASALAVLVFVLIIEYKSKLTDSIAIICILLACMFHTTGFILIPLFLIIKMPKNRINLVLFGMSMIVLAFFFEPFMLLLARITNPISQRLAQQILTYFSEDSYNVGDGFAAGFIKGLPYYFISLYGVIRREYYRKRIENYDNYLIVVSTGAFMYFVSIYSGWLSRFVYLFSFVTFVFFGLMMKELKIYTNSVILKLFVFSSLAVVTYRFLYLVYAMWGGF